ncbi:MAG: aspartate--tRNA(Asn) ligase [Candidatus Hodarchaeota archaeon]
MNIFGMNPNLKTHTTVDIHKDNIGTPVALGGWVHQLRDTGKLIFIKIRDSKGIAQIVVKKDKVSEAVFAIAQKLTLESVITVKGDIVAHEKARTGAEIRPNEILVHALAQPRVPIDITAKKTRTDIDTIYRFRELSIRMPRTVMIMNIKSEVAKATRDFYTSKGFVEIFTPFILGTGTEGGASMFHVDYYGKKAVLAQSNQFYKQAATAVHEKVFGIIPSWRAEKFHTPRHLSEFFQIETEVAWATDQELMIIQEELVKYVVEYVLESCSHELENLGRTDLKVPSLPLKRLTFAEAKKLAAKLGQAEPEDEDFGTPAETVLSKHFTDPFFITAFPTHIRGMYYEVDPNDPSVTNSLDLVAPEGFGEISSGGIRVHNPERLIERIQRKGLKPESFEWYLRMFRYGMPPHAGFGLGFERLVRWIAGLDSLREAVMFPRTPDLISP